ncbi:hypothetical protein RAD16_23590 [Bradyrhizobium sp. 18BD]
MPAEVGILLVHGIGTQNRGETLVTYGEPLFKTIKGGVELPGSEVVEGPDPKTREKTSEDESPASSPKVGRVRLLDSFLSPLINDVPNRLVPPHVQLSITNSDDPGEVPIKWVMAECHWATSFPAPNARKVTLWIMRVLPWVCVTFVSRRLQIAIKATRSALAAPGSRPLEIARLGAGGLLPALCLPLITPLVVIFELCLAGLLIVQLVPLKIVQDIVVRINAAISSVLGDSFIFTSSAFRQQAVVSKLLRDIDWLETTFECKRIVVMAHSQGAAIAYLALRQRELSSVKLLITFGAGILKLHQLSGEEGGYRTMGLSIPIFVSGVMMLLLGYNLLSEPGWFETFLAGFAALAYLVMAAFFASSDYSAEILDASDDLARKNIKWVDIFATLDPVPNGPIFITPNENIESIEVCNSSSLIGDHTSYDLNRDVFFPYVVSAIARSVETNVSLNPLDPAKLSLFQAGRRVRISSEKLDHLLLLLALAGVLFHREAVIAAGDWLSGWINYACHTAADVGHCWPFAASATGLGITLCSYMFLRLSVQAIAALSHHFSEMREVRFLSIGIFFGAVRHFLACISLSFVALLYFSQIVPPFSWSPNPSRFVQAYMIGNIATIPLAFLDAYRMRRIRKAGKRDGRRKDSDGSD